MDKKARPSLCTFEEGDRDYLDQLRQEGELVICDPNEHKGVETVHWRGNPGVNMQSRDGGMPSLTARCFRLGWWPAIPR
jgi:hypothetical protein